MPAVGPIESFAAVLAAYAPDTSGSTLDESPDLPSRSAAVAPAKRDYQACRYSEVDGASPALLGRLQAACAVLDGKARSRAYPLSAEAHHVAASILFRVGDQGLGWLAADRNMQAPRVSLQCTGGSGWSYPKQPWEDLTLPSALPVRSRGAGMR